MSSDRTLVADVMSSPLETIAKDATVRDAAEQMREQDINGLFVRVSEGGIVTQTDVVQVVADSDDPTAVTVGDVMTAPVESVKTTVEIGEAAQMMTTYEIKHLPVIDRHRDYVGMISSTDITEALA
ncbi:CBS domain-containing protein [Halorientalis marina]|uniref:CBS domain-containing protein n=1 Tax=Halorientalis marina TaxID=2931976 RepID=UPI001FF16EA6|nr:CBS domain-containing protein [Halorientalis marina]